VVVEVFRTLNKERGQSIVMVTHEPDDSRYVDRGVWLKDGTVQAGDGLSGRDAASAAS